MGSEVSLGKRKALSQKVIVVFVQYNLLITIY